MSVFIICLLVVKACRSERVEKRLVLDPRKPLGECISSYNNIWPLGNQCWSWPDSFNYKSLRSCFDVVHNFDPVKYCLDESTQKNPKKKSVYISPGLTGRLLQCDKDCDSKELLNLSRENWWPSASDLVAHLTRGSQNKPRPFNR